MGQLQHKNKEFGLYLWDTFDNETILLDEFDNRAEAALHARWKFRIDPNGADQVEVVDRQGRILEQYKIKGDRWPLPSLENFKTNELVMQFHD